MSTRRIAVLVVDTEMDDDAFDDFINVEIINEIRTHLREGEKAAFVALEQLSDVPEQEGRQELERAFREAIAFSEGRDANDDVRT